MRRNALAGTPYRVVSKIGEGSFGQVFSAVWEDQDVAVKVENESSRVPQLRHEYALLKKLQTGVGMPQVFEFRSAGSSLMLVMELLGPSVHELFLRAEKSFAPGFVLQLALQMLSRLEFIHSRGIIHRDIKPDNFVLGRGSRAHQVFLIDYGIAQYYRDSGSLEHIPLTQNHALRGTAKYCSLNMHRGLEQSRRDDLESLGYVLVYLSKGKLPWDSYRSPVKAERLRGVGNLKENTSLKSLCSDLLDPFEPFLTYCRALDFPERPDYKYLKRLFSDALKGLEGNWSPQDLRLPDLSDQKDEEIGEEDGGSSHFTDLDL